MFLSYPGRQNFTASQFVSLRPDVASLKVYDLQLSTGELLYQCAPGGIGVTTEKFIPQIHAFMQRKNCVSVVEEMWTREFKQGESEEAYLAAKVRFNSKKPRITSWSDCARLYCLLTASGYQHRYHNKAFVASYFPYKLDLESLALASELSRDKKLEFDTTDMFSFKDEEVDKNTLVYINVPYRYDRYGLGYVWSKRKMSTIQRVFNDMDQLGYRICVSALYEKRGYILHKDDLFPSFRKDVITYKSDEKYGFVRRTSEIYYTNFTL